MTADIDAFLSEKEGGGGIDKMTHVGKSSTICLHAVLVNK